MIFVARPAKPPPSLDLANVGSVGARELVRARAKESFEFGAYKSEDVKQALDQLFHRKCAYCESSYAATEPVDVEHYRPKGAVEDNPGHSGYWWLAMRWDNLLPSCIDCNRRRRQTTATLGMSLADLEAAITGGRTNGSGKKDAFPTRNGFWAQQENDDLDKEDPLLINPTRRDPKGHLEWLLDEPLLIVAPKRAGDMEDPYGTASIHCYGLNRSGLVQARTMMLLSLRIQAESIRDILEMMAEGRAPRLRKRLAARAATMIRHLQASCDARMPYSAAARVFVDRFLAELQKW